MKRIPWNRVPMPPAVRSMGRRARYHWRKSVRTPYLAHVNKRKVYRCLEIGPSEDGRIDSFETLNIVDGSNVDYVSDASGRLPFADDTFDILYASHILEHIAWYHSEDVLREWKRVLKAGGRMEIWVPDGIKVCKALVDAELHNDVYTDLDGWYPFNEERDPCRWASTRLFTIGDGTGNPHHWNWHKALFTPRYMGELMKRIGLSNIRRLEPHEVRGFDHGWINMGFSGQKP